MAQRLGIPDKHLSDGLVRGVLDLEELVASEAACKACRGHASCTAPQRGVQTWGVYEHGPFAGDLVLARHHCSPARIQTETEQEEARTLNLLQSSRLPPGTEHMTLESFEPGIGTHEALKLAMDLATRPDQGDRRKGLLFSGPEGVGKTHLAVGILKTRLAANRQGVFATVPDLLDDLRRMVKNGADNDAAMTLLRKARLLILDDLDKGRPTEWAIERLFVLFNGRELDGTTMIVTTNTTTNAELVARLGAPIVSRLLGMCERVPMDGPDRRPKGGRPSNGP